MTNPNNSDNQVDETYTLYLIRHGEAMHNAKEKLAKEQARKDAEAEGLSPEEVQERIEAAQMAVLDDDTFFDAPLSEAGKLEAETARETMKALQERGFPPVDEVYVSPLQRALQTAAIIFPDCDNVHVREDLRERKTGRACDLRHTAEFLSERGSFSRFSMVQLRTRSLTSSMLEELRSSIQMKDDDDDDVDEYMKERDKAIVEEKAALRERTKRLARFLMETDHRVLAAVTHKAYLRELERGTFGKEDATEFSNCEVRVYKVKCKNYDLSAIERVA